MQHALIVLVFFLIGTALASFLWNVVYRMQQGKDFLHGRSQCEHCHHALGLPELIPILGYLLYRGRCRYCRAGVSARYPLTELASGLLFALAGFRFFDLSSWQTDPLAILLNLGFVLWILGVWLFITLYDSETMLILDKVVIPASLVTLLLQLLRAPSEWQSVLLAALVGGGIIGFIVWITRDRGMGRGDIKLAILIGLAVGWPFLLIALLTAFITGAVFGLLLVGLHRKSVRAAIPFGPFLCLGGYIALLFGAEIWQWYWQSLVF